VKEEDLQILRESLQDSKVDPSILEEIAAKVESHVDVLSDEIEKVTHTEVRREKRKNGADGRNP
jgi:hypothetical protein